MNEKYIVTIYQKFDLSENVMAFRRVGVAKDVVITEEDGMDEVTYYDSQRQRVTIGSMDDDYVMISDDQYCYGYPMAMDDLKNSFPECKTIEELEKKYWEELSPVVNIGYYDEENDKVKILVTNEEILKQQDEDELFRYFKIEYSSADEEFLSITLDDFKKLYKMLVEKKFDEVKEHFDILNRNVESIDEQVNNQYGEVLNKEKTADEETVESILEQLDKLVGLENIKQKIVELITYLEFTKKTEKYLNLEKPKLHMIFSGNPGTGKTTVARLVGKLLYKLGYLPNNRYVEITSKDLIAGYLGQTALKTAQLLEENKGSLIFIDEAYSLVTGSTEYGNEALVEIMSALDKNESIFIFAGYKDKMEILLKSNEGFKSRVDFHLDFKNYTTEQLYEMLEDKTSQMGFIIDEELKEKIINNLENAQIDKNFSNGRYIESLIRKMILTHAINTDSYKQKNKLITLTKEDLKEDREELDLNDIMNKLDSLTGLENVKLEVNKLMKKLMFKNKTSDCLNLGDTNLNMIFTGNPGTGKTTVARIISELLFKLGYTKNNKFTEITTKDLIGEYMGQTAPKTAALLEKYRGGVIFIDEAYALASSSLGFAEESISEIIKELERKETVFIFAGYKKEMDDFMKMNSGLTSRIGYYIDYKDYTIEQLYEIFESKVTKMGYKIDNSLKEKIIANLEIAKTHDNFGNGRYIDKLIDKLELEHSINTENYKQKNKLITLTDKDYTKEVEDTLLYKVKTKKIGF